MASATSLAKKARKDNITANHQGEPISDAISLVVESELLEPKKDSLSDTKEIEENGIPACNNFTISIQEVDNSTFSIIGPDPYYEEEIVDIYSAEEREDQRQSQSPQIYAEESADLATDDASTDM
ncbi:hypothetical protein FOPG_16924 [Fusarium oxysporum f. sp. conglutinans race 2 54008]|nr:hypothetical protein FOPG_16924 [Fusarium oxysporum f. sp. conglutinans race 2 54008]